jgi:hypothetical protein
MSKVDEIASDSMYDKFIQMKNLGKLDSDFGT